MATFLNFKGLKNPDTGDILTNPYISQSLTVNGSPAEPDADGVISLAAGGTYVLNGRHYGRIVIGTAVDEPTDDTFIILNGIEIHANDTFAYGIYYAPKAQSLYVTVGRNTINTIVCNYQQEIASNQGAALFSENNMIVQGCGYLALVNRGGHALRASELRISGTPHIYAEASHDGIHGNSNLVIDGGFFYVNGANDAFGTGETGSIHVFDGKFHCFNILQNAFDSKQPGKFLNALDLLTDAATPVSNMTAITNAEFGVASVVAGDTPITPVDGTYTIAGLAEGVEVNVSGYIEGNIVVSVAKSTVNLNGCKLTGSLSYSLGSSNMQVNSANDTVNIISGGIASSNNVKIETKGGSHLIVNNASGNGISGSEVTIHDSKGTFIVSAAQAGIQGTDIYIADSADHKAYEFESVYGAIIANSIHARLSSKGKKGNVTIKAENLRGCVLAQSVSAEEGSTQTTGINLGRSANVFCKAITGDTLSAIVPLTSEPWDYIPYGIGSFPVVL